MRRLSGFSLMEMMIVLAIVAIVAAASAPMINKKMVTASGVTPWSTVPEGIVYLGGKNRTVSVGKNVPNGVGNTKLYINSHNIKVPHISFGDSDGKPMHLVAHQNHHAVLLTDKFPEKFYGATLIGDNTKGTNHSTALGSWANSGGSYSIAIGSGWGDDKGTLQTHAENDYDIAIGSYAHAASGASHTSPSIAMGIWSSAQGDSSTAIGSYAHADTTNAVAIGHRANVKANDGIAIGPGASASGIGSIALGGTASEHYSFSALGFSRAQGLGSIAMGWNAHADGAGAVALGFSEATGNDSLAISPGWVQTSGALAQRAEASGDDSIAIGVNSHARGDNSVAIGTLAIADNDNEIVLGTANHTVHIPGNLVVDGNVTFANANSVISIPNLLVPGNFITQGTVSLGYPTIIQDKWGGRYSLDEFNSGEQKFKSFWNHAATRNINGITITTRASDRRLKNVGQAFQAGLAEIKKLEVFHYTYKDDKYKTPHIGVMAQDLKKIFPDAVIKGEDGFLRIRMEDMFYALVNAVKELDLKLLSHDKKIADLEKQNQEQQKLILQLQDRIEALEKTK